MSAATSLYSTVQQLSLTLGIAAGAAILEVATALGHHAEPTLSDFSLGFLGVAAISLLAAPVSLMMPRDAGDEMSGHGAATASPRS